MKKLLKAHGGVDAWRNFKSLEFDLERSGIHEHYAVDLINRKVRITSDAYEIGFDGDHVWVIPEPGALKYPFGPHFYHSIYYYRAAMPFVFADPGVNYEELPDEIIGEKRYRVIKVWFDQGIGDSPDDSYILYINPETGILEWQLYKITYDERAGNRYRAYVFEWQQVNGLKMPFKGIPFNNWSDSLKSLGEANNSRTAYFRNVKLSKKPFTDKQFSIPKNAVIIDKN